MASQGDSSGSHFRFLDLPAEIRNAIYSLALTERNEDHYHYLGQVRLPAIIKTSKQIRSEALPLFFRHSHFDVITSSNFELHAKTRESENIVIEVADHEETRLAGELGLNKLTIEMLSRLGAAARSGHVRFALYKKSELAEDSREYRFRNNPPQLPSVANLDLDLDQSTTGKYHVRGNIEYEPPACAPPHNLFTAADIEEAISRASAVARRIMSQEGFVGLSLADLEAVAFAFRFLRPAARCQTNG